MEKYGPKFTKVLLRPDPHYIPGYAGYCPQLKFSMGKSYGHLTAELLTSPAVRRSNCLVLKELQDPSKLSDIPESKQRTMVPGYTGFIPRAQHYFACSYSEMCRKALSEFYQEMRTQRASAELPANDRNANQQFQNLLSQRPRLPLTETSDKVFVYKPPMPFTSAGRPYSMDDNDPQKCFISGFKGHVPKSRFLFGKTYSNTTNQALITFGRQQRNEPWDHDTTWRKESSLSPLPTICLPNRS